MRQLDDDVVPDLALGQVEHVAEPRVDDLLAVRLVDGLVHVAEGVEIAPADVDALLGQAQ